MQRKRFIGTGEVWDYKVRINAHGRQQIHGISYWEAFTPAVTQATVCLLQSKSLFMVGNQYI